MKTVLDHTPNLTVGRTVESSVKILQTVNSGPGILPGMDVHGTVKEENVILANYGQKQNKLLEMQIGYQEQKDVTAYREIGILKFCSISCTAL